MLKVVNLQFQMKIHHLQRLPLGEGLEEIDIKSEHKVLGMN